MWQRQLLSLPEHCVHSYHAAKYLHDFKWQGRARPAQQKLQVTCFPKPISLAQYEGHPCVIFPLVEQGGDKEARAAQHCRVGNPRAACSSRAVTAGPSPFTSLRTKQHVCLELHTFWGVFKQAPDFYPPCAHHQCGKSQCFGLKSTHCDHDAAPKEVSIKQKGYFFTLFPLSIFPLKGHRANYADVILHKSKG